MPDSESLDDPIPVPPSFWLSDPSDDPDADPGDGGDRPYLGSIPDFGSNADGMAITGVSPGSPADKAGMKAGVIITKLGESKIGGIEDLQSALLKHKVGDKIKVIVKRDGKEVTLDVTLAKRGG